MCCTSDNHNDMCHTCAKEFFKRSGYVAVYGYLATGLNSRVRLYSA